MLSIGDYKMEKGIFVISLDFELLWGVRDHATISTYGKQILGARTAVNEILSLFQTYQIHATWGIVGFLFFEHKKMLLDNLPKELPKYNRSHLSNYEYLYEIGESESEDPYHFGASLIKEIYQTQNQEIASHTFSHYYCREQGQTENQFKADIERVLWIAKCWNLEIKSIIFPRNQVNEEYLKICIENGIKNYRGEDKNFIYRGSNTWWKRGMRFAEVYLGWISTHIYTRKEIPEKYMNNIRAGIFLRPYSHKFFFIEQLKLFHIKRRMKKAAKKGKVLHIWFHPHNFGRNIKENLQNLESLLQYFRELNIRYGFQSMNMEEVAQVVEKGKNI